MYLLFITLYGAVCNGFEAGKIHYEGNFNGWALKIKTFSGTVKNAVELLGAPSRNSVLMLKKYNITDEIFWLFSHVFFFLPC